MSLDILINLIYIVSAILFIYGLKMLSSPATARRGNFISAIGMFLAVVTTLINKEVVDFQWIVLGFVIGAVIGAFAARLIAMTQMPEMVALFNGFGGIASLLVGWGVYHSGPSVDSLTITTIFLSILIGGVTFSGSLIAFAKLSEIIGGKPTLFPGQKVFNVLILIAIIAAGVLFIISPVSSYDILIAIIVLSLILGVLAVIPIGGADMPVVISLLNSYSGLAACAAGFVIQNNILIVSGALVGASGIILTKIMCKAMNRSLSNVLFSGFGATTTGKGGKQEGEVKPIVAEDAYYILEAASSVAFVPGYGLAVAQAQHVVRELGDLLEANGAEVYYAIHPVAGRMPGHMNVLLAEANVPYDKLYEMDDINPIMNTVDVAVVIGANDVVNPAARHDEESPIFGMPIINVDYAKTVFVLKRSMAAGFAGIGNELFFAPNTRMLFGDAKASISAVVAEFKES
ncbi:MAG: NAD(P)(+) transhydrogenase (Re/Si-specific) subunit beta [Calditrichia bacterium]|nr:NAD(P)(+) transhydrogenase (Re/Si-specific) subunit beta [Calditrichia bacterium]